MGKTRDPQRESVRAANYAQAQQCFHDYKGPPYRFHDQIADLQKTVHQADSDGLVPQPGLRAIRLSFSEINLDVDAPEEGLRSFSSPPISPLVSFNDLAAFRVLRELRISPEPLDVEHNIKKELQQYLDGIRSEQSCNILNEWLPLSPVDIDRDEGLEFSSASSRWQKLALRELERETIAISEGARQLVRNAEDMNLDRNAGWLKGDDLGLQVRPRAYPEPVSPPLSPTSSLDGPFIPDPGVAIIDLTSEPSSPICLPVQKLQNGLQNGCLDSAPAAPSATSRSSSPPSCLMCLGSPSCKTARLKVDVPLLISSPFQPERTDSFLESLGPNEINTEEMELQPTGTKRFFDEAMEDLINSCRERATQSAEEEQLNYRNSFLRIQVPTLNFEHPVPEWGDHLSSPEVQFSWMSRTFPPVFLLPPATSTAQLGSSLKWTPIPPGRDRVLFNEALELPRAARQQYLMLESPCIGSRDYVPHTPDLTILRVLDDEEIEPDTPDTTDSNTAPSQGSGSASEVPTVSSHQDTLDELWKSRLPISSRSLRKKATEDGSNLLPHSNDSSATSKLLSSFMQLRHPNKKLKLTEDSSSRNIKPKDQMTPKPRPPAKVDQQSSSETSLNLVKASAPEFFVPTRICRYIVSMSLNRNVLSRIEKTWSQIELIDKDFSQYNEVQWSPGSAKRQEAISPLSFEADIALSPSVGIILTTMLKVKQKPLPGSNSPTPFRDRVQRVSEKYESLFILVSEANPQGEYVGAPSASDMSAYADFVRFTTALQADITTELVHGADETLSKWILALMSRFASHSSSFSHLIDARDTPWALFLRRAGLNIVASQALDNMLAAEYGGLGMDRFLAMSLEERISKYGQVMGGDRVLRNVSRQLGNGGYK